MHQRGRHCLRVRLRHTEAEIYQIQPPCKDGDHLDRFNFSRVRVGVRVRVRVRIVWIDFINMCSARPV